MDWGVRSRRRWQTVSSSATRSVSMLLSKPCANVCGCGRQRFVRFTGSPGSAAWRGSCSRTWKHCSHELSGFRGPRRLLADARNGAYVAWAGHFSGAQTLLPEPVSAGARNLYSLTTTLKRWRMLAPRQQKMLTRGHRPLRSGRSRTVGLRVVPARFGVWLGPRSCRVTGSASSQALHLFRSHI